MDFDSIISMLFILLFFLFPTLLRQLRQKALKKASHSNKNDKKKKNTIFSRIGDQIQKVLREIEEQQRQQKLAAQKDPDDFWEDLEDEDGHTYGDENRTEAEQQTLVPVVESESVPLPAQPSSGMAEIGMTGIGDTDGSASLFEEKRRTLKNRYRKNRLQNAVVWAEILGKPVALKK